VSGILDKKQRIIDFIITEEGRDQAANGELRIHYASFSDAGAFYTEKSGSYAEDISNRIAFEVNVKPQDTIVLENPPLFAVDSIAARQSINPFQTKDFKIAGTNIAKISESGQATTLLTGSAYNKFADDICTSLTQNFHDMQIIGTFDPFDDSSGFEIFPEQKVFDYFPRTNNDNGKTTESFVSVESCESLFQDERLSHLPNFMYLPPVNKSTGDDLVALGEYNNFNREAIDGFDDLISMLHDPQKEIPYVDFEFAETSRDNNILVQPIEFANDSIQKLAIIDFGEFIDDDSKGNRVFFLGKMYPDDNGNSTYVNIFTVILS